MNRTTQTATDALFEAKYQWAEAYKKYWGISCIDLVEDKKRLKKKSRKELIKIALEQADLLEQYRRNINTFEGRIYDKNQEIAEIKEALDRRRQLYKSMEDLVNRGQPKSIEDMAKSLRDHEMEIVEELKLKSGYKNMEYSELPEEVRDEFVSCLMKIIS